MLPFLPLPPLAVRLRPVGIWRLTLRRIDLDLDLDLDLDCDRDSDRELGRNFAFSSAVLDIAEAEGGGDDRSNGGGGSY